MAQGDKPYTVYRGGKARGFVPGAGEAGQDAAPRRRRSRSRRRRLWLLTGAVLLGAVVLVVAWGIAGFVVFQGGVAGAGKRVDAATRVELSGAGGALWSRSTTILMMGTDHSEAGGRNGNRHADSLLLIRTDPSRHRIAYLSIPRDLYVEIPGHGRAKINAAYQIDGAALQLRTVKAFTGLAIDHVVLVDFGSFRELIDSIGGVTVDNPAPILSNRFDCPFSAEKCRGWKGWSFTRGKLHLDGRRALAYARVRDNRLDPADTDITRGTRQQQVVNAVGAKLASVSTFLSLPFDGDTLLKPLATDLSAWELVQLGWARFRADGGKALHCRLGGDPATVGRSSVILPSESNRETLLMFTGRSAPQPPAPGGAYHPGCTVGEARPATATRG